MAYSPGDVRLNGSHPIKIHYHFFNHALFRNKRLEITHFNTLERINVPRLEEEHDVLLLPRIDEAACLALRDIKDAGIPVIAYPYDPHRVLRQDMVGMADRLKVDWLFNFQSPASFYEYWPRRFRYETVHIGLEPSLYKEDIPWGARTPDRIALSGALGRTGLARMLYQRVYLRRPPPLTTDYHYKLRTRCNKLPYVVHTRDIYPDQSSNELNSVLSRFRAAIAAMTTSVVVKYKETPAAGCLTFMEVTEKNHGVSHLGYEDGKNAVFIDESNYLKKFREYLDSPDDGRWRKIAREGRRHALENLSNDRGVEMLVDIMYKALGEKNAD